MELQAVAGPLAQQPAETLVLPLAEQTRRLAGVVAEVDTALGGALGAMLREGLITGRAGEHIQIPALGRIPAKRVVVQGLGPRDRITIDSLRDAAATTARALRGMNAGAVAWAAQPPLGISSEAAGRALAEGAVLGLYRFDRHHTRAEDRPRGSVTALSFVESNERRAMETRRGVATGRILAESANFMRDLANEPANLMTPTIVASRAQELAAATGLECRIIERAEAERLGMGSYLSVANGSQQPPKFIVLRYQGGRGRRAIGLVGKGITFDTGGISIKPAEGMDRMKGDMSGAASVIAAIGAIARLQPAVNVLAVAPCTENMPGGSATKPGDVVYAMDGTSIEVLNTDAEGRLVLADGLAFARREGCSALIDVATLTGAMSVTLGNVRIGAFSNNDRLYGELERAASRSGERIWRLPLDREYDDMIKSDVADIKNTGGRLAGSITAAKFLERFVGDTPWAHLDIAGVMDAASEKGVLVKGSSGKPVRTLVEFVLGRARA